MIERFLQGLAGKVEEPAATERVTVLLPEDLDPEDRHLRFSASLDAELRLTGLGYSDGGGAMFAMDADEFGDLLFTVVDVNATEVDGARWHLSQERTIDEA